MPPETAEPPELLVTFLVEHYWPGSSAERFRETAEHVRATAEAMAHDGAPIRCLHSILVPTDEAAFCLFDAASAEVIEQLYLRAGVGFDRIVDALEI